MGFLVTVFSALRLAKFNVDERQQTDFIGLNTPMNTFLVISLPFIAKDYPALVYNEITLIVLILLCSYLLVSEIRLFSMKLNSLAWSPNRFKYSFIMISIVALISLKFLALPLILALYILMSAMHFSSVESATK